MPSALNNTLQAGCMGIKRECARACVCVCVCVCVCLCVCVCVCLCVCVFQFNDVPRVAQRYGTLAAHTQRRASVLVVFVVFRVHYFPAQSSLGADILVYWIGKIVRTCAPGGSRILDFLRARRAPYPLGQALRLKENTNLMFFLYQSYQARPGTA